MARPIRISKSNYYILLMHDVVKLQRDEPDLFPHLLNLLLRKYARKIEYEYRLNLNTVLPYIDVIAAVCGENPDELEQYLTRGREKIDPIAYRTFLEYLLDNLSMEILASPDDFKIRSSTKFGIEYYMDRLWDRRNTQTGFRLVNKVPTDLQYQISLLAHGYSDYLHAIEVDGKSKTVICDEMESRPEFKKQYLTNVRQEYNRYDVYFNRIEYFLNEYNVEHDMRLSTGQIALTREQKSNLISTCSIAIEALTGSS